MVDRNKAPNGANEGISRPLIGVPVPSQIGDGRGTSAASPNASLNVIAFDPFRAIRRGRQLFQRKFSADQGQGAVTGDGLGDIEGTSTSRSARASPTVARRATGVRAARPDSAATSLRDPTAATRRTSSGSA